MKSTYKHTQLDEKIIQNKEEILITARLRVLHTPHRTSSPPRMSPPPKFMNYSNADLCDFAAQEAAMPLKKSFTQTTQ